MSANLHRNTLEAPSSERTIATRSEPAPSSVLALPVLDPARLEQLDELASANNPNPRGMILGVYLHDMPLRLAGLESAVHTGDLDHVGRIAHAIKGASGNVGAARVAETSRQIEFLAASGHLPDAQLLAALRSELANVVDRLETNELQQGPIGA